MASNTDAIMDKSEGLFTDSVVEDCTESAEESEDEDNCYISDEEDMEAYHSFLFPGIKSREVLLDLATQILALDIDEKETVHAEKMIACGSEFYSRGFYEFAVRLLVLQKAGYDLKTAVRSLAGSIPDLDDSDEIQWGLHSIHSFTFEELIKHAQPYKKVDFDGPDRSLLNRITGRKAGIEERKVFALRLVDYWRRIPDHDTFMDRFFADQGRCKKELDFLRKNTQYVKLADEVYEVPTPFFPHWTDDDLWDTDVDRGYGEPFVPCIDLPPLREVLDSFTPSKKRLAAAVPPVIPLPSSDIVPSSQQLPGYTDDVVENSLIEEEEYEVAIEDPDVFEDEELYAAQDAEKNHLLAEAVNFPQNFRIENLSARTLQNFPHIALKSTVLTARDIEQREADAAMLSEAMIYSSFKEELKACEAAMKKDPDNKLLKGALSRLLDSQEQVDAIDSATQNEPVDLLSTVTHTSTDLAGPSSVLPIVSGSDAAGPSSCMPPVTSLPEDFDVNAYSQLDAPLVSEEEWPSLATHKTTHPEQQQNPPPNSNTQPVKNVWVEKNKAKKTFMNAGIGGRLPHVQPTTPEFFVDVSKTPTIQDIWGFSLLGQYVGHNPGHFLVHSMMKSWAVRAKYKVEEGWFIFTFESEADREKVLIGGPYLIHGRPMLLKTIPDKFAFNKKDLALVPLWVRIYGLASRFWSPEILGGIASYVGSPMFMDPVTDSRKRNAYARVLVEVNLAAPVTKTVPIRFSDGDATEVHFLVENQPKFCTSCCSYGHVISECHFLATKSTSAAKKAVQQPANKPPDKGHNNNIPGSRNSNQTARRDVVLNSGEPHIQQQVKGGVSHGNGGAQPQFVGSVGPVEEGETHDNATHQQHMLQTTVSAAFAAVHSDISLANQFAALNDASDVPILSDGHDLGAKITVNSEDIIGQQATTLALTYEGNDNGRGKSTEQQEADEHMNKKEDSATPLNKQSIGDTWIKTGPNTRSRKKGNKP